MMQRIQKWFAIRNYAKKLGPQLRKRYGASRYYTPEQVKATVRACGLNLDWVCYALCMYCDRDSFIQYHFNVGEACDYGAMQSEVAAQFFHNHNRGLFNEVDASTVINSTISSWCDGSGYDGGCFDGGGSCDGGTGD
ncbi:MAG: hypothetical protein IGS50_13360 [Synechococcales cyanobacterium C42_A2020_086]|nr:hypothetical protein [Synechococcales cyanobacterium M58_A2018_015]MBF2074734.1 hypothetical protein [Synechococcales cyanobacterium C42_A2020_086]